MLFRSPIPMKGFMGYRYFKEPEMNKNTVNEAYQPQFRVHELDDLPSFNKKLDYCKKYLGPTFGRESSRVVFDFTDEAVLKLAYNKKGVEQNWNEDDMSRNNNIVVDCLEVADDHTWIIQEAALPAKQTDFQKILGIKWDDFCKLVGYIYNMYANPRERFRMSAMSKEDFEKYIDDEQNQNAWWFNEFYGLMANWQLPYGDLIRISSYGVVKRDGKAMIVVIDAGLTSDTFDAFYSKGLKETKGKNIIITEDQYARSYKHILSEAFVVNSALVQDIKEYLDKGFKRVKYDDLNADGELEERYAVSIINAQGQPLQTISPNKLLGKLDSKFQGRIKDDTSRRKFLKQVIIDWFNNNISKEGMLTVNNIK